MTFLSNFIYVASSTLMKDPTVSKCKKISRMRLVSEAHHIHYIFTSVSDLVPVYKA